MIVVRLGLCCYSDHFSCQCQLNKFVVEGCVIVNVTGMSAPVGLPCGEQTEHETRTGHRQSTVCRHAQEKR